MFKDHEQTLETMVSHVEEIFTDTQSMKKKMGTFLDKELPVMKHDLHRLTEVIAPPEVVPIPDPVTGLFKIGDFFFPIDHVHKLKDLNEALEVSLGENEERERCKFFFDVVSTFLPSLYR